MEFIDCNLRANQNFIALVPLQGAKHVLELSCLVTAGWKITPFFLKYTNNQQVILAGWKECTVIAKIVINTFPWRLKKMKWYTDVIDADTCLLELLERTAFLDGCGYFCVANHPATNSWKHFIQKEGIQYA